MTETALIQDPYNLIITGVGGQGNVLASKVLANILVKTGLDVTIGETFGASQRGGSVMSHLRISGKATWSPQIPKGRAHAVIALEPIEALRTLARYGNPETVVLLNTRPIHPIGVICGEREYPEMDRIESWVKRFSSRHWFLPATEEAVRLGAPILGNIIMIGALAGTGILPVSREVFAEVISSSMPPEKAEINLQAFDIGIRMI